MTDERTFERWAAAMDGEEIELSAAERAQVEELLREERSAAAMLDVSVPPVAMAKAQARLTAALELKRPRVLHLGRWFTAAASAVAAAAAAIVLAMVLNQPNTTNLPNGNNIVQTPPITDEGHPLASVPLPIEFNSPVDQKLDLLARRISEVGAEFASPMVPQPEGAGAAASGGPTTPS